MNPSRTAIGSPRFPSTVEYVSSGLPQSAKYLFNPVTTASYFRTDFLVLVLSETRLVLSETVLVLSETVLVLSETVLVLERPHNDRVPLSTTSD
jgi:hypothetical protein